jgi:glycosyltransferase involved in cell wall biosynthesis
MILTLALLALLCSAIPAILFCINLRAYAPPSADIPAELPAVSILIPARNEAHGIADALRAALSTSGQPFEIIVMDDASTDATTQIVQSFAALDSRIRLAHAPPLPAGWNGKQHACWALAHTARNPILCFVDADVRLTPDCVPRMTAFLASTQSSLVSGFPRQITGTPLEWLLLPLIHFVLLGFLPLAKMRASTDPAFAAGCGQFLLARRDDYFTCGGHSGIKVTMHDGLRLPRLFRQHKLCTDLADITNLATCRMYTTAAQVWQGLAKNATEGIAAPVRIAPVTLVLLLGQVLPFAVLALVLAGFLFTRYFAGFYGIDIHVTSPRTAAAELLVFTLAAAAAWLPRILAARRFHQDPRSALLHPIGIFVLLLIQWYALIRQLLNRPVTWKSRAYTDNEPTLPNPTQTLSS